MSYDGVLKSLDYFFTIALNRVPSRAFTTAVRSVPGVTLQVAVLEAKSTLASETPSMELRASTTCGGQPPAHVIPPTWRDTVW